jgi:hypothetical protein
MGLQVELEDETCTKKGQAGKLLQAGRASTFATGMHDSSIMEDPDDEFSDDYDSEDEEGSS